MGEEQIVDDELAFVKETAVLEGLSVEDREKYVWGVMTAFAESVDKITKIKGKIKQGKRIQALQNRLAADEGKQGKEVMVCALYAVKKKYRPLFVKLISVVSGVEMPDSVS